MNHFVIKNETYELNDIILLKNKQRQIEKLKILKISKYNDYYNLELKFVDCNYEKNKSVKIYPDRKHLFFKKFISYSESKEIFCKKMRKKQTVYCFECNFCNEIHKHNNLGQNDCKCTSIYSPYKNYGYKLILDDLDFNNLNDYILYNYKLYLQTTISSTTIMWYIRYLKQFYKGELCNNYGVDVFPYINYNIIKDISVKFSNEPKIKNLITSLKKFIIFMKTATFTYHLDEYKLDIDKIKIYYNQESKNNNTKKDDKKETKSENKNDKETKKKEKIQNIKKDNQNNKEEDNEIIMPRIRDINLIKLDIEIDIKKHISKKIKNEIRYLILNNYDKPLFYHKLKISDKYTEYDDLWLTIQYYNNFVWGISETYTDGADFINYKVNIMNQKNKQLIDDDDY